MGAKGNPTFQQFPLEGKNDRSGATQRTQVGKKEADFSENQTEFCQRKNDDKTRNKLCRSGKHLLGEEIGKPPNKWGKRGGRGEKRTTLLISRKDRSERKWTQKGTSVRKRGKKKKQQGVGRQEGHFQRKRVKRGKEHKVVTFFRGGKF